MTLLDCQCRRGGKQGEALVLATKTDEEEYLLLNVTVSKNNNNNNNNNNIIYIAPYTKVLKRFTMEGGTGIIKTYIT